MESPPGLPAVTTLLMGAGWAGGEGLVPSRFWEPQSLGVSSPPLSVLALGGNYSDRLKLYSLHSSFKSFSEMSYIMPQYLSFSHLVAKDFVYLDLVCPCSDDPDLVLLAGTLISVSEWSMQKLLKWCLKRKQCVS